MTQLVLDREQVVSEIRRRNQAVLDKITALSLSTGTVKGKDVTHQFSLELLTSKVQNLCVVCSRRAGKTWAICCLLLLTALGTSNTNSLYLGLTSAPAKKVFNQIWKRVLAKYKLASPLAVHSETEQSTTFYNGSTVTFGGVDDLVHVQTLLGSSMAGGLAVIDEAQSGKSSVLVPLVEDVLSPMLDETNEQHPDPGRLLIAGTQPKVRAGFLYDTMTRVKDLTNRWQILRWSRFQNPFLTDNETRLKEHLEKLGLNITDPIIRANWFGEDVYDEQATAYRYREDRNQYKADPAPWSIGTNWFPEGMEGSALFVQARPGIDTFAIGLDPAASSDRFAIVIWGWSGKSPQGIYHIGEWVTGQAANAFESTYFGVIKRLCQQYRPVIAIIRDAGSASTTQDPAFLAEYSLVIEPAKKGKGSKKARVDRLKDLLGTGRARILAGSELEKDLKLARFDPDKRAEGKYDWTSDCHPDVADAATYAIPAYIESIQAKKKTTIEIEQEQEQAAWSPPTPMYGPKPELASIDSAPLPEDDSYGGNWN